jgi:hypothetical protein
MIVHIFTYTMKQKESEFCQNFTCSLVKDVNNFCAMANRYLTLDE